MVAVACARSNIALVKYWGKRDAALNLPSVGSLSLTLAGLTTRTEVRFDPWPGDDLLILNGRTDAGPARLRVQCFLDLVRAAADRRGRAQVRSANSFPTASGLASSASAFAALALAATRAAGLELAPRELAALARRGSGSAARSIFGGFVEMDLEGFARPLAPPDAWDVRMVIALAETAQKPILSTSGMSRTADSSPYYAAWLESHASDMAQARAALETRDLAALGEVAEASCLKMHAAAMAARPGILYWNGVTVELIRCVRRLREAGTLCWFTIDAGPHVKVLCGPDDAERIEAELGAVPGVTRTCVAPPGEGVELVDAHPAAEVR
jgi:diphosphomevalonate decarboxylase